MEDSAKAIATAIMGGRRRRVAVIVMVARRSERLGWIVVAVAVAVAERLYAAK